jgi:hypothetical protein
VDLVLNWEKCHFMVKQCIVLDMLYLREALKWTRLR